MRHSLLALCLVLGCKNGSSPTQPVAAAAATAPVPRAAESFPETTDPAGWLRAVAARLSAQVEDATDLSQKTYDIPKLISGEFWRDHLKQAAEALCQAKTALAAPPMTIPEGQIANLNELRAAATDVCALRGRLDDVANGQRQDLADLLDQLQAAQMKTNTALDGVNSGVPVRGAAPPP